MPLVHQSYTEDFEMRKIELLYILVVSLILAGCGGRDSTPGGSGLVEATDVLFSAQTAGQLLRLNFDEGDNIRIGDTIAVIDTTTVVLRLRQAEAALKAAQSRVEISSFNIKQASFNLELADKEFNRISELIKTGAANQQQFDQTETAHRQAELARESAQAAYQAAQADLNNAYAQLDLLKKQYNDCFPTSPLSGVVVNKYTETGELVAVGKPIVKIAKLDTVWVKIYLPPSDLTRISLKGGAKVDPEDGHNAPLDGWISVISDQAEFTPKNVQTKEARADLVYAVKVDIPNPETILKVGMPVSVRLSTNK
jgi:HlyD family secretion protein